MMKRLSFVLFGVLLPLMLHAQTITSSVYSPLRFEQVRFPYAETDFISTRLQGIGYPLFNVVEDTISALFRNPAEIYSLTTPQFYATYERPFFRSSNIQVFPLGDDFGLFNTPPIVIEYTFVTPPIGARNRNVLDDRFSRNPAMTLGYWTPRDKLLNIPIGFFLRGTIDRDDSDNNSVDFDLDPNDGGEQIGLSSNSERIKDWYGQAWAGLLNAENAQVALSYSFLYHNFHDNSDYNSRRLNQFQDQFSDRRDQSLTQKKIAAQRHRLSLGGTFLSGNWKFQPEISAVIFSNKNDYKASSVNTRLQYVISPEDSLISDNLSNVSERFSSEINVNGIEFDFQADNRKTVFFATGFLGSIPTEESRSTRKSARDVRYTGQQSTFSEENDVSVDDNGSIFRFRAGVGQRFQASEKVKIYGAAITEYEHNSLSGSLPSRFMQKEMNSGIDSSTIDITFQDELDVSNKQFRLILPVGLEVKHRFLSARFGMVWSYKNFSGSNTLDSEILAQRFKNSSGEDGTERDEFFGMGLRWKKVDVNISALSDIFQFSNWNVALRYLL